MQTINDTTRACANLGQIINLDKVDVVEFDSGRRSLIPGLEFVVCHIAELGIGHCPDTNEVIVCKVSPSKGGRGEGEGGRE